MGTADLTRDNGYSAALNFRPMPFLELELGCTRSVPLHLHTASFGVGFNLSYLFKRAKGPVSTP